MLLQGDPLSGLAQRLHDGATVWFQCSHGSPGRHRLRCEARGVAAYVLRTKYGVSYPRLARLFGFGGHASALQACRSVTNYQGTYRAAGVASVQRLLDDQPEPQP